VAELRAAKLDNFNLDLMFALPDQSLAEALADVRTACALDPAHISYYQLTLESGTVFHSRPPVLPDDEAAWEMQSQGQALLAAAGFLQYEVSAYARAGRRCRHNLNYWSFGDYCGVGAGAHGKLSFAAPDHIMRTEKPKQPREYLTQTLAAGAALGERRLIASADLPFEFMLNALRLNEGFAIRDFEGRTGLPMSAAEPALSRVQRQGLLEGTADGWRPTELGRRFLNDLQAAFLD
jgi:putative oxygen-independent coproporphyrinogen III oxidase